MRNISKQIILLTAIGFCACTVEKPNADENLNLTVKKSTEQLLEVDDPESMLVGRWKLVHEDGSDQDKVHIIEIVAEDSNYGRRYVAPLTGDMLYFELKGQDISFRRTVPVTIGGTKDYYQRVYYRYTGRFSEDMMQGKYEFVEHLDYRNDKFEPVLPAEIDREFHVSPVKWMATRVE